MEARNLVSHIESTESTKENGMHVVAPVSLAGVLVFWALL